jgi:hypothetical protein
LSLVVEVQAELAAAVVLVDIAVLLLVNLRVVVEL